MKTPLAYCICILIMMGNSHDSSGQQYSLSINKATFTLEGAAIDGYSTVFVQPFKEVKKEWWRYVNARTIIFNKKTHLVLTIPAQNKEANAPLKFVSQLIEGKGGKSSVLSMALATDDVPADQQAMLKAKAKHLLKDFKVSYFTKLVQEEIEMQETISKKISMEMDKYLLNNVKLQQWVIKKPAEKDKYLEKMAINTQHIEALQTQLNAEQALLSKRKKTLTQIK